MCPLGLGSSQSASLEVEVIESLKVIMKEPSVNESFWQSVMGLWSWGEMLTEVTEVKSTN